ncbi:MAG: class I adenylate-forming enzyme family protein [Pseudomonadota bacterium]
MLSVFDTGGCAPPPASFNMAAYVLTAGQAQPDKIALEIVGAKSRRITFAELHHTVATTASGLMGAGLQPGDRVLLRLGNRFEFPLVYLAALWAGLVPVPTSAQLTQTEIDKLASLCAPRLCISEDGIAVPRDVAILSCEDLARMKTLQPAAPIMGSPDRLAYIIFTSGTSGTPRGVCHAHRAIWARRMMFDGWYGLRAKDRVLHAGAFNWTYTMGTGLMDPWTKGATALIPEDGTDPADLPGLLDNAEATIFAAAPGVYRKMLPHVSAPPKTLRHGLSAGEHLSETIRQAWQSRTGTQLHQALGMSECSTFISSSPDAPAPPDTSGLPQRGRKVAILKDGEPLPCGEDGMLAISTRDPGLMLNYIGEPTLAGAWFETGDQARMAEDGTITYLGRQDDMMNAGGFRVSPLEVETSFTGQPGIDACAAVQIRIKQDADVIALFHTGQAHEQDLRAHAERNLARYKQPRLYIQRDALPYGANGKLNRRALRASFEAP